MLTLHKTETKYTVTLPKEEFLKLIDNYQRYEPIEISDNDPDYLTEEEMKIRAKAMEELEKGETISFEEWQKELRKREKKETLANV